MKLPVVNEKEVLVLNKTLRYLINDKSVLWMIHREYLEDRGWSCNDIFTREGYKYLIYKKEVIKANNNYEG